ncbi:MAG: hypothetical protein ISS25_01960 [Nanoarchaeota archaeon]|nr:hypothetical protein [DPANN group archaeon]MBL7116571.1 hypothetical protein [Nanoarchaeota archaeon]
MKELNKVIRKLELELKLLHSSKSVLLRERRRRKISKEDYEFHKRIREDTETKAKYRKEIEQRLAEAKVKLREEREKLRYRDERRAGIGLAAIIVLLLSLTVLSNYEGITGYLTFTREQTITETINKTFTENITLELNFTNATSLRISGDIIGRGRARVLLDIDGTLFTVMDEFTTIKEPTNLITGLVIGEDEENISEENITIEEEIVENITIDENITIEENITTLEVLNISEANVTIEENVTENITIENTTITPENVTIEENITEEINVTPEENVSENISEDINITINVTENITKDINVTQNITENVTPEINITLEENITINVTPEINITENITEEINVTINITENITVEENITINITPEINITENITEVFSFTDECMETCLLEIPAGRLVIKLENVELKIDNITYKKEIDNKPPIQTKEIENVTFFNKYSLNASEYFKDPEGEILIFDVKEVPEIKATIENSIITFTTNKSGIYETFIYVTDGTSLVKSNVFSLRVGSVENITVNITPKLEENITQLPAVIGQPVKWRKVVRVLEPTNKLIVKITEEAYNIRVIEGETDKEIAREKLSVVENNTRKKLEQYETEKEMEKISEEIEKEKDTTKIQELENELKKLEEKRTSLITGVVILEQKEPGILTKLLEKTSSYVQTATITGRVIQEVPEATIEEEIEEETVEEIEIEEEEEEEKVETQEDEVDDKVEDKVKKEKKKEKKEKKSKEKKEDKEEEEEPDEEEETPETNITEDFNITPEINVTINITENITTNATPEMNVSENITINVTENITKDINESINVTQNITENVTLEINITLEENITINITLVKNITEKINLSENITTNITEYTNITINITPETNITENITIEINVTENVTPIINVTENITIENITITPENVTIEENITEEINITAENVSLIIEHNATDYIIEYETSTPYIIEEEINVYKKIVTITGILPYERVLAFTNIIPSPEENIGLYWIRNGTKTRFENVTYVDTDNDRLIDRLEWIVPHLSNQTFEITITVLNAKSYPMVGGFWTVQLNTTGQADLEVIPINLTTFVNESIPKYNGEDDLEFEEFLCGDTPVTDLWISTTEECINNTLETDDSTYCYIEENKTFVNYTELQQTNLSINVTSFKIYDYECENISYWTDTVRTSGAHYILFTFGPDNATAENWAVKNATSKTLNATVSIRRPSGTMTSIQGAYMLLNHTTEDTQKWHNTTWVHNYTTDCQEEGNYEVYVELMSLGNSGAEKDRTGIAEAITYWIDSCIIAGAGNINCTVHAKSNSSDSTWKVFGGRLELLNGSSSRAVCNITSVGGDADAYWTADGQDTCSGSECGQWIEFYHNVSSTDEDETTFTITCDDGSDDNSVVLLNLNETCGPSICGNATISQGGFDACNNPTCSDNFTYIGNDTVESLGGFDLMTYDIGILDTWGWGTVSTYNIDWDSDQKDCDCYVGSTNCNSGSCYNTTGNIIGFTDGGSNYNASCCGDDSSEYYNETGYTNLESVPTISAACCNSTTSCVSASTCYANTTSIASIDSDSDTDYCIEGIWYDCGSDSDCSSGQFCNSSDCEGSEINITFESPTPAHDSIQINNQVTINVSVSSLGSNVDACILEWNGVNETMDRQGSGTSVTCNTTKTTTDGTVYTYKVFANNTVGLWSSSTTRNFTENSVPSISSISLTTETGNNLTTETLNCSFTISDSENTSLYAYYKWYNGTNLKDSGGVSMTSGVENSILLGSGNTTKGETWYCEITPYDGFENGTAQNTSLTILNSNPSVTLTAPTNDTVLTQYSNRTPTFTWSASDNDSIDTLNYTIWIYEDSALTSLNRSNYTQSMIFIPSSDLGLDMPYWWIVEVYDGSSRVNSTVWNFTIQSYKAINLTTSTVDFGNMLPNVNKDTENNATPFKIENIGNIFVNLTIYANTTLWTNAAINTSYYRYRADVEESGAFNTTNSQTTWKNMDNVSTDLLKELNFSVSADEAQIDINITVPDKEPPGTKSSQIIVTAE